MKFLAKPSPTKPGRVRRTRARTGVIHIHSDYSHDGRDSLEGLRAWALERGVGFIAMADHAEDFTSARYAEFTERCRALSDDAVRILPGLEFRFAGFPGLHLLAFGLREWITPATPAAFIAQAPSRSRMTALAHPVLARYRIPQEVLAGVDAIEVWNAAYNTRYLPDPRSMRLVDDLRRTRPGLIATAGLDQHDATNDRELRVVLDEPTDDPLGALRAGRFMNQGRTVSFYGDASWHAAELVAVSGARWVIDRVDAWQERAARRRSAPARA